MKKEYEIPMFAIFFFSEEDIACDPLSGSLMDENSHDVGGDDIGDWDN